MASFDYVIKDVHGIHARPATELFKLIKGNHTAGGGGHQYGTTFVLSFLERESLAKGVMGIMSLGAKQGDSVKFSFEGAEADALMAEVKAFMEANL